ncbi:response regulator [bacterium]|nr:response regulator [bacterium]
MPDIKKHAPAPAPPPAAGGPPSPPSIDRSALGNHLYAVCKDAVVAIDAKLQILHFSPAAARMFRVSEEQAIGDRIDHFVAETQREAFVKVLGRFFEKENALTRTALEVTAIRGQGTPIRCEIQLTSFPVRDGLQVMGLFRDVTERRKAAQKLHEAQKMEVIDRLAGEVAHDVNNLLVSVQGYAELMKQTTNDADREQYVKDIEGLVRKGGALMRDLRGFARAGGRADDKSKLAPVDLNASIIRLREFLLRAIGGNIVIEPKLTDNLPLINADLDQFDKAIMDVCINARDAMPDGGVLSLETSAFTADAEHLRTHPGMPSGQLVQLCVRDTGKGMPEEVLRKVFEPFFTTKSDQGGAGLGLTLVYKTVKNHGGYVAVESEPGKGTAVRIYFPALSADAKPAAPAEEKVVRGTGTILVVDDEPPVLETTSKLLGGIGYTVYTASGGEEGVKIFDVRRDEIALVLVDMKMPGKSGLEAFQEMKNMRPGVRAILMTGYSIRGDTDAMFRLGLKAYLLKPFTLAALSGLIDRVLNESPSVAAPPMDDRFLAELEQGSV